MVMMMRVMSGREDHDGNDNDVVNDREDGDGNEDDINE